MTRILSILMALVFSFGFSPDKVKATPDTPMSRAGEVIIDGLHYRIFNNAQKTFTLTSCDDDVTDVVIPSEVEYEGVSWQVTDVRSEAFANKMLLISVSWPESITTIPRRCFSGSSLQSIALPSTLTKIESEAFKDCANLSKISIPSSVLTIESSAFVRCSSLSELVIENSETSLLVSTAFSSTPISSLFLGRNISGSTSSYDKGGLFGTSLTNATVGGSATEVPASCFSGCSYLTEVKLSSAITKIGGGAFSNCTSLTSLSLPKSLTEIDHTAFSGCIGLTDVELPEKLTKIGGAAFSRCTNLRNITGSPNLTDLGPEVFKECSSLETFEIPSSLKELSYGFFRSCTGLKEMRIPATVESVGDDAFSNAHIEKLIIEDSDKALIIGGNTDIWTPFNCGIEELYLGRNIELDGTFAYPDAVFNETQNVKLGFNVTNLCNKLFKGNELLKNIDFTSNILMISDEAFAGCTSLTSVAFNEGLETIGSGAFAGCTSLTSVAFNDGLESIGSGAFEGCSVLKDVVLPASVTEIADKAFAGCYLDEVTCQGEVPAKISNTSFSDYTYVTAKLTVPDNAREAYRTADGWRLFKNVDGTELPDQPIEPGVPIDINVNIDIPGSLLNYVDRNKVKDIVSIKISGQINGTDLSVINLCTNLETLDLSAATVVAGGEPYYMNDGKRWYTSDDEINQYWLHGVSPTNLMLPDVTKVGVMACRDMRITSLQLPWRLREIGDYAFSNCAGMTSVSVPDSVVTIGNGAFYGCQDLSDISFGVSVAEIGNNAFGATTLYNVQSWNPQPAEIAENTFTKFTLENATLTVYEPFQARYWLNSVWGKFAHMVTEQLPAQIQELEFSDYSAKLQKEEVYQIRVYINPWDATIQRLIWSSSDEEVATVDEYGNVTATGYGEAVITATTVDGSNLSREFSVKVVDPSGIDTSTKDEIGAEDVIFTLAGRRVYSRADLVNGVYIINGRKVMVN